MLSFKALDGRNLRMSGVAEDDLRITLRAPVVTGERERPTAVTFQRNVTLDQLRAEALPTHVKVDAVREYVYAGRPLLIAQLRFLQSLEKTTLPPRLVMWIGWQSKSGVLRTAFESDSFAAAAELFERVRFDDTPDGLVIESPIDESSRPVAMLAYAPSLGLIDSSPRDSISNAGRVPTNEGTATAGGAKMYWTSTRQRSVLLVHETAFTTVQPTANQDLAGVADLEISWTRDPSTSG